MSVETKNMLGRGSKGLNEGIGERQGGVRKVAMDGVLMRSDARSVMSSRGAVQEGRTSV